MDQALYEAATIDGASKWQKVLYIDIPHLLPTVTMMLILNCGSLMSSSTDKTLLLQTGGNMAKSDIIGTYVYTIGLYNKAWICILMGCVSVWNIMLARTYIKTTIPDALYEAANLDGASQIQYFLQIVLPLSGTIIGVLAVYYGVAKWNDYWTGLVYINKRELLPLQTILKETLASLQSSRELLMSMVSDSADSDAELLNRAQIAKYCIIVVSTVPAVVLYLCMQKFFVKGVMIGSIKG